MEKGFEEIVYPIIDGVYEHYKGGIYKVISMAIHTETNEVMVIYKSLLFGSVFVRPLSSWNSTISRYSVQRQRFSLRKR